MKKRSKKGLEPVGSFSGLRSHGLDDNFQPSQQFIHHLEQELRYAFRAQYQQKKGFGWSIVAKILPAFSGGFVVALLLINFIFKSGATTQTQVLLQDQQINTGTEIIVFNEDQAEEDLINNFNTEELDQIYNSIHLAAASN